MATCPLTASFTVYDCEAPAGGLDEVYILPFADLASITVADCLVSAIDDGVASWAKYELNEQTGIMGAVENKSIENNSLFYEANLQFATAGLDSAKCKELGLMAIQRLVVIGKTVSGKYFLMGDERGAHKAGGTNDSTTGTAFGDLNGYNVNFLSTQTHDIYEVDAAVIAGLTFY